MNRPNAEKPTAIILGGLMILRQFEATGIPTLLIPRSRLCLSRYSRFAKLTGLYLDELLSNEELAIQQLVSLASQQNSRPLLYFGDDRVLDFLRRHRTLLTQHYRICLPDQDLLRACLSKFEFDSLAQKYDLPTPPSIFGDPYTSVEAIESSLGYPCVLKPDSHIGWFNSEAVKAASGMPQKVLIVRNRDECVQALTNIQSFTSKFSIQRWIRGSEENVYSFHTYVPFYNKISASYVGQKIRTYPSFGGESSLVKLTTDDEVWRLGHDIVKKLDIRGIAKLDFKRDADSGELFLMEINLRFNLWNYLGAEAGLNLVAYSYCDLQEIEYTPPKIRKTALRWLHFSRDFRAFTKDYYPNGKLSLIRWLASLVGRNRYAVYRSSDPMPFIRSVARILVSKDKR